MDIDDGVEEDMRDMDGREVNALIIQEPMQRRVFDCRDRCGERDGRGVCYFANGCFGQGKEFIVLGVLV